MKTYQTDHIRLAFAAVDAWNDVCDIGTPVTFTSGLDAAKPVQTKTIGAAYLEASQPMICIEASRYPVRLSQVKTRE